MELKELEQFVQKKIKNFNKDEIKDNNEKGYSFGLLIRDVIVLQTLQQIEELGSDAVLNEIKKAYNL